MLITGVGKGTKLLSNFLSCTKTYEAVVLFGVSTDSYDCVGKVVNRAPYEHVTREKVEEALKDFRGDIMQRPSIFSALKVQGKKLYEYAREGIAPPTEILERPVTVSNLEIVDWYDSGSHEFQWPTEEADENQKAMARKVSAPKGTADSAAAAPAASEQVETKEQEAEQESKKRKTPPPSEEAATSTEPAEPTENPEQPSTEQSSSKKQKLDDSEQQQQQQQPPVETATTTTEPSAPDATPVPQPPAVKLRMTVSSGFYVRSLAHDLGVALGSNAIMMTLNRTRQGDFDLTPEKIIEYKDLEEGEEVWGPKLQRSLNIWRDNNPEWWEAAFKEDKQYGDRRSGDRRSPNRKSAEREQGDKRRSASPAGGEEQSVAAP